LQKHAQTTAITVTVEIILTNKCTSSIQ